MVTRKDIYTKPRNKKRSSIRSTYSYIFLFAILGIATYVGYGFLAKDQFGFYVTYSKFFYVYNIAVFMILNLIFLYSVMEKGIKKTLGFIGISALSFLVFNLISIFIARLFFNNLEPSIIDILFNFNDTKLTIKDAILFNYIPVFLSLAMWALLTFIMMPFSKISSLKRDRKSSFEAQGRV